MKLSPQVRATHEPAPHVTDPIRTRPFYLDNCDDAELRRRFREFRAWTLWRLKQQGLRYVELNGMKFYAPSIASMMPNAKFVFIHRHPAEFVRSGMRRGWYVDHPADGNRLKPRNDDSAAEQWANWQTFEKICWLWDATNRYFLTFLAALPTDRYRNLPFDTLMDVETNSYQELFTLINVSPPDHTTAAEVLTVKYNSQESQEFPEYDRWSEAQRTTLFSIAGKTMQELGYE